MSNYTQAFNGSNFLGQWQQISETLDTIDASRFDTTFKTSLLRFKKVYKFVDGLMQNIDPDYLPMQDISTTLPQSAQNCLSNLSVANAGSQPHLDAANQHLDAILTAIKPYAFYDKQIKASLRTAIKTYASEMDKHLENIADTQAIFDEAKNHKEYIETYYNELFKGDETTNSIRDQITRLTEHAEAQVDEIDQFHTRVFEEDNGEEPLLQSIESAKKTAVADSTEIRNTLESIKKKVNKLEQFYTKTFGQEDNDGIRQGGHEKKISDLFEELEKYKTEQETKHHKLFEKIESLLPGATNAGLAKSYEERKQTYKLPILIWNAIFFVCVLLMVGFSYYHITSATNWGDILKRIIHYAPIYIPVIWLAIYATKRRSESRALEEEYAHKEALAKSYSSYKKQIEEISQGDPELMVKLLGQTIDTISENPSDVLNRKHGDETMITAVIQEFQKASKIGVSKD